MWRVLCANFSSRTVGQGHTPSTLKVYVAAITMNHSLVAGQRVGKNVEHCSEVESSSYQDCADVGFVLSSKGPTFETLQSAGLRVMTLKTALLLALVSVKRVGDLQAMSVSAFCLELGPMRRGYVPKVLSTLFRAQVHCKKMLFYWDFLSCFQPRYLKIKKDFLDK